jgi:hypothetical protein
VDSAQDQIMLRTVPCCGSMGSMICRGGLVRANLYLVIPIFSSNENMPNEKWMNSIWVWKGVSYVSTSFLKRGL